MDDFDTAYRIFYQSVERYAENPFEYALWCAWGDGAVYLRRSLKDVPAFKTIPDSLPKAKSVVELLIQPMVSMWYHNWETQEEHPDEEKEMTRRISFQNVQNFLDLPSEESMKILVGLDEQLRVFLEGKVNTPILYIIAFHMRYCECVTDKPIIKWDKLRFPVEYHAELLDVCDKSAYKDIGPRDALITHAKISLAQRIMSGSFASLLKRG